MRTKFSASLLVLAICVLHKFEQHEAKFMKRKSTRTPDSDHGHDPWGGNWFPHPPSAHVESQSVTSDRQTADSLSTACDSVTATVDYNPSDKRSSFNHLCLSNRTQFEPNLQTVALLYDYHIPPAYVPAVKCQNETIQYAETMPTFGSFRLYPPRYGTYKYLPPQRWLHSLAEGSIVMLYHPCAFSGQVKLLEKIIQGCVYRHIITPSQALEPQRPMAILAWGKMLRLSVVDEHMVADFIRQNAKHGPIEKPPQIYGNVPLYELDLEVEAHLITDAQDVEICGYNEMK